MLQRVIRLELFPRHSATDIVNKYDVEDADQQSNNPERKIQRNDAATTVVAVDFEKKGADVVGCWEFWSGATCNERRGFVGESCKGQVREVERVVRESELEGGCVPLCNETGGVAVLLGFFVVLVQVEMVQAGLQARFCPTVD